MFLARWALSCLPYALQAVGSANSTLGVPRTCCISSAQLDASSHMVACWLQVCSRQPHIPKVSPWAHDTMAPSLMRSPYVQVLPWAVQTSKGRASRPRPKLQQAHTPTGRSPIPQAHTPHPILQAHNLARTKYPRPQPPKGTHTFRPQSNSPGSIPQAQYPRPNPPGPNIDAELDPKSDQKLDRNVDPVFYKRC